MESWGRVSVSSCFDRGWRRRRGAPLKFVGKPCIDDGLRLRYSLELTGDVIREVHFEASTCVTLVAYSERLAQLVTGRTLARAIDLQPATLVAELPGVPALKQRRAVLPIRALHSAIANARPPETGT